MAQSETKFVKNRLFIWLAGVSFLLFQFFLQLSSGVIIGSIMQEQNLSALCAGLLSSAFYYVYTTFQIPVGLFFDRYNTRSLLAINAVICALGCFLFASGHSLYTLFLGRLIIGAGSSFAFIGLSHVLRQTYPLKRYAFMIGLSETLGFTATVLGMIGLGAFITNLGWRYFIHEAGILGLIIASLCWLIIPNYQSGRPIRLNFRQQLFCILKNKLAWLNGLFVCLEFSVITVFSALWAVPFLQIKLDCSLNTASILTSMILLGAGFSCPIFGQISVHLNKRKPLIHFSCISTAILLTAALYLPIHNPVWMGLLLFSIGLCCGAYMLAYTISNELAPAESLSTCTGFTNTLAMISAPLLQPFVGYLLDYFSEMKGEYTLSNYQSALMVIPGVLIGASLVSQCLPEKKS